MLEDNPELKSPFQIEKEFLNLQDIKNRVETCKECDLHINRCKSVFSKGNDKAKIMLIGATKQGRDLAPRISSKLNTGLTADCTKLEIVNFKGEEKLASTRPTFGGSLMDQV